MMRIKRLPELIANQIAAGEVIERPASVVKELLENALDAQATKITVALGFGGLNLIQVSDNGTGIWAEDLALAVAPHATSKISQLNDLYAIQSMGFRGEALASMASISRLVIRSKPASQTHAMMLEVLNQELTILPCARSEGTTIEVHDLFFNAPVRKKFLKSERGEFQAIDAMVKRIAMSMPHVAISLLHNDKLQWQVNAATCESSMRARILKLLGKKFIEEALYIDAEHAGMRLHGWLGGIASQKSQNDGLWVYLNQRMIKDKLLNHAIKQAYAPLLHPGRHPVCLLYLSMDPALVDVNVHPTKHEVRFQQARFVHDFVVSQLSTALHEIPFSVGVQTENHAATNLTYASFSGLACAVETKQSYSQGLHEASSHDTKVIPLAKPYALLHLHNEVYVCDMRGLRARWCLYYLQQQDLPWVGRPILVPMRYWMDPLIFSSHTVSLHPPSKDLDWVLVKPRPCGPAHHPWQDGSKTQPVPAESSLLKNGETVEINDSYLENSTSFFADRFLLLQQLGIELVVLKDQAFQVRSLPGLFPQLDIRDFLDQVFLMETLDLQSLFNLLAKTYAEHPAIMGSIEETIFLDYVEQAREVLSQDHALIKKLDASLCEEILRD